MSTPQGKSFNYNIRLHITAPESEKPACWQPSHNEADTPFLKGSLCSTPQWAPERLRNPVKQRHFSKIRNMYIYIYIYEYKPNYYPQRNLYPKIKRKLQWKSKNYRIRKNLKKKPHFLNKVKKPVDD